MSEPPSEASLRGTAPPAPDDPELVRVLRAQGPGERVFDRFRLERELGAGGMAVVWLAHDERLGLPVALKFLSGMVARDPEALEGLRAEITRGLRLTHPGIVRIYDLHEDAEAGRAAIAMEYIDGACVADEKARQPGRCFDVGEPLLSWTRALCEVLQYVHERAKVVHRDLKPRNLMLTSEGELKVADFGIAATLCESHTRLTQQQGSSSGTPAYMSPQQVVGRHPAVADDIYSLGATLYELLTSKPPFFRGTATVIMNQVSSEMPPTMAERRAELGVTDHPIVPAVWEETIAACLAKEPADRPASASAVARRLGLLVGRAGQVSPPPLAAVEPELPGTRRRSGVWIWLLAVLAGAGVAALPAVRVPLARLGAEGAMAPTPAPATARAPVAAQAVVAAASKRVATPGPAATPAAPVIASLAKPFVNSLGMRFVPVPIHGGPTGGRRVLFSVWDTRVQDFAVFMKETGHGHPQPSFPQGPMHPVVDIGWREPRTFCEWLSRREGHVYRLPTDHEWSCAVGIGEAENPDIHSKRKDGVVREFPWGPKFPPPANSGNYAQSLLVDGFEFTSPVGSFPANRFGLYDMGGNVWQWCEEAYPPQLDAAHLTQRGGSWFVGVEIYMRSSARQYRSEAERPGTNGFRCVLEGD